jgi:hypothetical protein
VIDVSGELSITKVAPEPVLPVDDESEFDEHAAVPAASSPVAATATNILWIGNPLFMLCDSSRVLHG